MKINNKSDHSMVTVRKSCERIEDLQTFIQTEYGVPPHHQKLMFNGSELKLGRTISSYGIKDNDTIDLEYHMHGGCFRCGRFDCCCIPIPLGCTIL
eukprot:TRINITY_DN1182_c0_g1_i1.p1 TRINITY_DN1182_c0_g1~~TRINITY_DN1182_c0_g1_i1.p1  ORF type:complete len:108 (-),score=5.62 TRINITY_DN1182_c0_g1_i1:78-365(-)